MALFGKTEAPSKSDELKTQIQQQIAQELAVVNATELVNKITENCYEKCVEVPGPSLTGAQDACVNMCMSKYMKSWNVVSKRYVERIQHSSV